jgi:hypothetical protein
VLADTQKLLDRVLFCAFAEDRGLLPVDTIQKAYEHRDPYHPRPIYDNFRGLFQAINCGNAALGIHAYNGGLFSEDSSLDHLQVSDDVCAYFRDLGGYDYPTRAKPIVSPSPRWPAVAAKMRLRGTSCKRKFSAGCCRDSGTTRAAHR